MRINSQRHLGANLEQAGVGLTPQPARIPGLLVAVVRVMQVIVCSIFLGQKPET